MPLETNPTAIDDLNPAWPINTDGVNEGDDHLRNVKTALQGSVSGTASEASLKLPAGTKVWEAIVGAVQQVRTTVGSVVMNLRGTAGGIQVAADSAGDGRIIALDAAGADAGDWVKFIRGGGVILFHGGAVKAAVTPNGVQVNNDGAAGVDTFVDLTKNDSAVARLIADESVTLLRAIGDRLRFERNGSEIVIDATGTETQLRGPGNVVGMTVNASGNLATDNILSVGTAPTSATNVVRKAELDAQDSRVSTLEGRWSGNNLTAAAIAADSLTVAGSPAVTRATVATETIPGSVEIATAAEVKAGTASNAASPAALAGNTNAGGTQIGFAGNVQQLSGTEQPTGPGTHSVTFSRPFTSAPRVLISPYISGTASGSSNQPIVVGDSISNTGFDVYIAGDVATGWRNFTWQAIGAY